MQHRTLRGFALFGAALLATAPAWAANGHLLHGVGAVNSSMGGAGVALPNDALGALSLNPALLTQIDGHKMEFSAEYNTAKNAVESEIGPFSGRTEEEGDPSLIPAFGFTVHKPGGASAFGVGFLGLAGFGVDYPQTAGNPITTPQPGGFGRIYSNYAYMKVPVTFAYQVTPNFSIGASLNAGRATLTANPAGFATPDCTSATNCVFPSVNADSAWGFGATVGMLWKASDRFNLGLSYATEQDFEDFEWHTTVANTASPNFGRDRTVKFQLNAPAQLTAGLGFKPTDRLSIALDGKQIFYEDTEGFKDVLGLRDITVISLGLQYQATPNFTLRLGGNHGDSAIESDRVFFTVPVPAVFEDHITAGFGMRVTPSLVANLGYYHVFENRVSGPIYSPATGPIPGSRITTEMAMDSFVATFSFDL
jgi:long-chain fatty acid transport protein